MIPLVDGMFISIGIAVVGVIIFAVVAKAVFFPKKKKKCEGCADCKDHK